MKPLGFVDADEWQVVVAEEDESPLPVLPIPLQLPFGRCTGGRPRGITLVSTAACMVRLAALPRQPAWNLFVPDSVTIGKKGHPGLKGGQGQ